MKNDQKRPLSSADTATKTFGCRHSNPDICKNNSTPDKCSFVRDDMMCLTPPRSWEKLFIRLRDKSMFTQDVNAQGKQ